METLLSSKARESACCGSRGSVEANRMVDTIIIKGASLKEAVPRT